MAKQPGETFIGIDPWARALTHPVQVRVYRGTVPHTRFVVTCIACRYAQQVGYGLSTSHRIASHHAEHCPEIQSWHRGLEFLPIFMREILIRSSRGMMQVG